MQNYNMSPALAAKLKNSNSQSASNNSGAQTVLKNNTNADTFVKRNKEVIVATSIVGSLALAVTTACAYLRGKAINTFDGKETKIISNLKEGFKSFFGKNKENYNLKIKKKKVAVDTDIKPKNLENDNTKPVDVEPTKVEPQKQEVDIKTAKINRHSFSAHGYAPTSVSLDKTSAENDLRLWAQKAQEAPKFASDDGQVLNDIDVERLQNLTPHTYQDTCDIYIQQRRHYSGFSSHTMGIVDGEFGELEGVESLTNYIEKNIDDVDMDCKLTTKITEDGRAFVIAKISNGCYDGNGRRQGFGHIVLESASGEYTQAQKDLIKVMKNSPDGRVPHVLRSAFIEEDTLSKTVPCKLFFNKNAFLSLLQSEAAKYPD